MRTLLAAFLFLAAARSEEIVDLGVITPKIGIQLEHGVERPDFSHFVVEIVPSVPPTNKVVVMVTNRLMTLQDVLTALPSGPALMGLKSVLIDGQESAVMLFKFDIRRAMPPPPTARRMPLVGVPQGELRQDLQDALKRVAESRVPPPPPPVPSQMMKNFRSRGVPLVPNADVGAPLPAFPAPEGIEPEIHPNPALDESTPPGRPNLRYEKSAYLYKENAAAPITILPPHAKPGDPVRPSLDGPTLPFEQWPDHVLPAGPPAPLPDGVNETYAEAMDAMVKFYNKHGRRNEQ